LDNHVHFKPGPNGVQRRFAHAVVLCEATNPYALDSGATKPLQQVCAAKCGVDVFVGMMVFADDLNIWWKSQIGVQFRAGRALTAVRGRWPATLFETNMFRRMPISRGEDGYVVAAGFLDPLIENRDNLIPVVNAQGSTRTKVILDVDDQ